MMNYFYNNKHTDKCLEKLPVDKNIKNLCIMICQKKMCINNILPESLTYLLFIGNNIEELQEDFLPKNLIYLIFDCPFKFEIKKNILPKSLIYLYFDWCFNSKFRKNTLPESLRYLTIWSNYNHDINTLELPINIRELICNNAKDIIYYKINLDIIIVNKCIYRMNGSLSLVFQIVNKRIKRIKQYFSHEKRINRTKELGEVYSDLEFFGRGTEPRTYCYMFSSKTLNKRRLLKKNDTNKTYHTYPNPHCYTQDIYEINTINKKNKTFLPYLE